METKFMNADTIKHLDAMQPMNTKTIHNIA